MFTEKKILITGAAGFIGFHLAKKLLKAGCGVVGLDSLNDYYDVNLKYSRLKEKGIDKSKIEYAKQINSTLYTNYNFIKLKLEDKEQIDNLFKNNKFDYVCNLAAQAGVRYSLTNPEAYINSNIVGFLNILESSKKHKIKHLVYASSSSVYGLNNNMPFSVSDSVAHPVSLYAATKKSNELMAHSYSHLYNLPTTGLRFFTVYGPWGRPDMALFLFVKAIINNQPINVYNHGNMVRDFTYVDDIVEGLARVIKKAPVENKEWNSSNPELSISSAPYKIYNIGNNNPVKLLDFIEAIELRLNKKSQKKMMPIQPGDVPATYADVSGLIKDFNYQPQTTIKDGVSNFIDWYLDFYN